MPEDGIVAKKIFLNLLSHDNVDKVYIKAFGFNMPEMLEELLALDSKGVEVNVLADYMQARGPSTWDKLVDFNSKLKHGSLVLTTAGYGSSEPSIIFHTKAMVVVMKDGPSLNWCGSCNFSSSGWLQANNARLFISKTWSEKFIEHFYVHRDWALQNAAHKQIKYILENPVQAKELEFTEYGEELSDYVIEISDLKKVNAKLKNTIYVISLAFIIVFITLMKMVFRI
jgi:hypothetical protein